MRATIGFAAACLLLLGAGADADEQAAARALPPIETADYDEQARFRVNGRPFFPILLYDAPTDDTTLAMLREFGFNTLTCKPDATGSLPEKGFYGAVHGAKTTVETSGILLVLGPDSPALYYKQDLLERVAQENGKAKGAVPGRPVMNAIGYWENEPKGVVAGELPSKSHYEDLVAAIEVSAPYLYPVPYQPTASVGEAVARARSATQGKKPILPILQLFAWEAGTRYPTVAELRSMTFLALVEGASGIGYYSFGSVTGRPNRTIAEVEPELWRSVKQLNREVAEIGPLLLGTNAAPALSLTGGASTVKFKAASTGAGFPAVVVNSAATTQEATLTARNITTGNITLDDGRTIDVRESTGRITLKPFESLILRRLDERRR
ncbi:MAG: hypothetical protein K8U03_15780 [Planctomycetia bacterium]|nr:hypothetical protein [Planctomycetia bacterium]